MGKRSLGLFVAALLAGCSGEHPAAHSNDERETAAATPASGGAGASSSATPSDGSPRLARLKDSAAGDSAAHYGILEVSGRCIFVKTGDGRSLIASTVPGARWDASERALMVDGARLPPGTPIFLSGSFAPTANLQGQWVDPPAEECVTPRAWIASGIRAG